MKWWYCLGGITAFLFVVQGINGIMLAFYYKPTAAEAYYSILYIENEVRFGAAICMIHNWAANGMIVMCVAHMLRVFIMGAYKKPRELNWVSGVLLLFLTLLFGFTGYLPGRSGENSFCCGGGGQMWLEVDANTRINHRRLADSVDAKVDVVATACLYCLLMFDDAIRSKGMGEQIKVMDIAEVLETQIGE